MHQPKVQPAGATEPVGGPARSARDREEARRARLLENAAHAARERKQNSRPTSSCSSRQGVNEPPPAYHDLFDPTTAGTNSPCPSEATAKLPDDQPGEGESETSKDLERLEEMSVNYMLQRQTGPRRRRRKFAVSM